MPMEMQEWRDSNATAEAAATALREVLKQLGASPRTLNSLRGTASHKGDALVHVGHLPAAIAERLAEHVRLAVAR
ncbi:hypothetical protein ACFWXK_15625 [Streptomyces sp. NPDC059070]|uniref:hypothetical protein n=1 Tax=Streptomyces sp. NPDC059070 TaxID=3346713 RepID=UPI00368715A3